MWLGKVLNDGDQPSVQEKQQQNSSIRLMGTKGGEEEAPASPGKPNNEAFKSVGFAAHQHY